MLDFNHTRNLQGLPNVYGPRWLGCTVQSSAGLRGWTLEVVTQLVSPLRTSWYRYGGDRFHVRLFNVIWADLVQTSYVFVPGRTRSLTYSRGPVVRKKQSREQLVIRLQRLWMRQYCLRSMGVAVGARGWLLTLGDVGSILARVGRTSLEGGLGFNVRRRINVVELSAALWALV